jgi:hypothetical protein
VRDRARCHNLQGGNRKAACVTISIFDAVFQMEQPQD